MDHNPVVYLGPEISAEAAAEAVANQWWYLTTYFHLEEEEDEMNYKLS